MLKIDSMWLGNAVVSLAGAAEGDRNPHSLMGVLLAVLGINYTQKTTSEDGSKTVGKTRPHRRE